ncbi:reverse transcriptase domain-containing protein [Tanacetum coccineum]|uniref:Reverse transcriptase domain-containing protein n=1 Tax=Tanacetum coccineum TaxID=301880 RepID=A0ABQ5II57_9ASTR
MVISFALSTVEKTKLLEVHRNHKRVIAWSIADIKGIDSSFCTHKVLMEDEFKPSVQPQRRVNPNIKEMLERLAGYEYYCFLDGFFGYFQIPIAPEDQEKTTFTCPYGTFAYKRMPFGLCNAPATFQRCMTAIFHELIEDSMEEKCHFMVKEGIILGHKVSGSGIEVDKAKIKAISKLPYPTNVKAIRSFLGHASFYRRFIKDFSQIAHPMTHLLVKDASLNFSEECIQAFNTLKCELT